jgi:hypothetical protein
VLDGVSEAMQRADARISAVRETIRAAQPIPIIWS